jgi:hypothetical protein
VLEDLSDTLVRLCGALEVLLGANLLANILGLTRVSEAIVTGNCKYEPALGLLASGKSCGAPQWSSGRSANPSCSQPG